MTAADAPVTAANAGMPDRLVPPRRRLFSWKVLAGLAVLVLVHWLAWGEAQMSIRALVSDFGNAVRLVRRSFPPDLSWSETVKPGLQGAWLTFAIALLGTTLALPFALVFAVLGSRRMSPNRLVFQVTRFVMSLLRAIPSFVFALIFVVVVGLGPYPGVLALTVHGIGVSAKLWWDAIDESDQGPVEALRTTGATRFQLLQHAVMPTVTPTFVSLTLFRLDDNVRSALVLGVVGAGGLGQLIDGSIQNFAYSSVATEIIIMLVMIVAIDQLASQMGRRLAARG